MTTERKQWVSWEEFNALFPGLSPYSVIDFQRVGGLTPGSIPFADATGFLIEDNANFFWDAANLRLGIGTATPDVSLDIEFDAVETVVSRVSAKTRPWRHWECVDGNWGLAIGILSDNGIIHFHYDSPIGTKDTCMMVFDGPNGRVGILDTTPSYPFDVGSNTQIQGTLRVTSNVTFLATLGVTGATTLAGLLTASSGILSPLDIAGPADQLIRFTGSRAAGKCAITYQDTGDGQRLIIQVQQNQNIVELLNRAANGTVEIHANTAVAGAGGDVLVVTFEDTDVTLANGIGFNLQEDITFTGATAQNLIKFPDNLVTALSFREGANAYLTFKTTNAAEAVIFGKVFTGVSGSTVGTLTLANGSITDSGGAISFGNENLSTTGTLAWRDFTHDTGADHNLFLGYLAGSSIAAGGQCNLFIGELAGQDLTIGDHNIFIGYRAGYNIDEGSYNIAIGRDALYAAAPDDYTLRNIAIGVEALYSAGSETEMNIAIGHQAFYSLGDRAVRNIAIGYRAGYNVGSECADSVLIGALAGYGAGGDFSMVVAIGYLAGYSLTIGSHNTIVGTEAGFKITAGSHNAILGHQAGYYLETGESNVMIGKFAGKGTTMHSAIQNVLIGEEAGLSIAQSALGNICVGYQSGKSITAGVLNICIGYQAGHDITTGEGNVIIGYMAAKGRLTNEANILWIANTDTATPLIYGEFDNAFIKINNHIYMLERSADPTEPAEGEMVIWMSDGTQKGDDGDVLIASKAGGATTVTTIHDHSAGAAW